MRLSRTSLQKAVTGVALGAGLAVGTSANAGIVFDVRFTDGTHTKLLTNTGTYSLQVWVRVQGANSNLSDDALISGYLQLLSTQGGTGAMNGAGDGLRNPDPTDYGTTANPVPYPYPIGGAPKYSYGTRVWPFADAPTGGTSRDGSGSDLNGDGVVDWGSLASSIEDTNYMVWRTENGKQEWGGGRPNVKGGYSSGQAAANGGWEWAIGQFNVVVSHLGTGTTRFGVAEPPGRVTTGQTNWVITIIDNVQVNANSDDTLHVFDTNNSDPQATHDAVFMVPEPASLGLLGAAAVGLLGRKRRK